MKHPPEMIERTDEKTGRRVVQLTSTPYRHVHVYFTENSFVKDKSEIILQSDRDTPGVDNLFSLNYESGEITRLTNFTEGKLRAVTKTPDAHYLLYAHDRTYYCFDTLLKEAIPLYTLPEGYAAGRLSMNCDQNVIGIQINEQAPVENGINYAGFEDRLYMIKRSAILRVERRGDGFGRPEIIFRDTTEGGHFQFSPVNPSLCMFCHEGPWNLVNQRIYLLDIASGEVWPCFRQEKQDSVGHEFFTRDGHIFFDNRGPGHDGTITSDLRQAVAAQPEKTDFIPYIGLCDESGNMLRKYELPFYCNHYSCDSTGKHLIGDDTYEIVSINLEQSPIRPQSLCQHLTSWHGQFTHPHPTISWDDRWALFASDRTGTVQLYLTEYEPDTVKR